MASTAIAKSKACSTKKFFRQYNFESVQIGIISLISYKNI